MCDPERQQLGWLAGRSVLSVDEAARLLGISPNSVGAAVQRGEIPALHFGRRVVVPVPALLLMLLGVDDVPGFLRQLGIASLPELIHWLTGPGG